MFKNVSCYSSKCSLIGTTEAAPQGSVPNQATLGSATLETPQPRSPQHHTNKVKLPKFPTKDHSQTQQHQNISMTFEQKLRSSHLQREHNKKPTIHPLNLKTSLAVFSSSTGGSSSTS
ncbi:hypothetical protein Droror1_Dr00025290 [Drosera rotundifolia]